MPVPARDSRWKTGPRVVSKRAALEHLEKIEADYVHALQAVKTLQAEARKVKALFPCMNDLKSALTALEASYTCFGRVHEDESRSRALEDEDAGRHDEPEK